MTRETHLVPAAPPPGEGAETLYRSLAATLKWATGIAVLGMLVTTGVGVVLEFPLLGIVPSASHLLIAVAAPFAGVLGLGALAWRLTGPVARTLVQPVELLLSQFGDDASSAYHWRAGRALYPRHIRSDLALLHRQTRQTTRRTEQLILDLDRARDQANSQNLAKSQFLANMSHELRTPLNAVLGYAMLLYEDATEAQNVATMADLDRIQQAGRNLLGIINEILDFARFETGRTTVVRSVIDVEAMVRSMAERYRSAAKRDGNSVSYRVDPGAEMLIGDHGKVAQCLNSLLSNACKFTQGGSIDLEASLSGADNELITFVVRDTGVGIDPAHLDGLFEAFERAAFSPTHQHGGAGLGLAIVRRLAEMMGGACTVESAPCAGSTFRLTLPLGDAREAAPPVRADRSADTLSDYAETPLAEHTILVVEDDEATVELIRRWLRRMGYNVLATNSGEDGLALARTHQPHLILLDAILPGRSGYDWLAELRVDPSISHIPTILVTVDDDRPRGLDAGATDYLRKPITENQLRRLLDVYRNPVDGEVLMIGNDNDAAGLVARCAGQIGISGRRALDGQEGLKMAIEKRPDAIVLDLATPLKNGFDVLDRLAADQSLSGVPLIVLSGADITLDEHRRLAKAGHRSLAKAVSTPRQISETLRELVA